MEVLLIDIGALAMFLGYVAIVYWHGVSCDARPRECRFTGVSRAAAARTRLETPGQPPFPSRPAP
jgi:hypothetical protein